MYHGEECALWLKLLNGFYLKTLNGQTKWTFVSFLTHDVRGTVLEYCKQYLGKIIPSITVLLHQTCVLS